MGLRKTADPVKQPYLVKHFGYGIKKICLSLTHTNMLIFIDWGLKQHEDVSIVGLSTISLSGNTFISPYQIHLDLTCYHDMNLVRRFIFFQLSRYWQDFLNKII